MNSGFGLLENGEFVRGLADIQAEAARGRGLPPVERWNPAHCGKIDLRIARDGTWFYLGTPIARPALVRLFSTILRREADGSYCLVTPVERAQIVVEDAPFLAVRCQFDQGDASRFEGCDCAFLTNVGDEFCAGMDHPLRIVHDPATQEPRPYVLVRNGLEARIARPVYYELVAHSVDAVIDGAKVFGFWSGGVFHSLGPSPNPQ
jgi:hypothetical protein